MDRTTTPDFSWCLLGTFHRALRGWHLARGRGRRKPVQPGKFRCETMAKGVLLEQRYKNLGTTPDRQQRRGGLPMNIRKTADGHIHILKGGVILRLTFAEASYV